EDRSGGNRASRTPRSCPRDRTGTPSSSKFLDRERGRTCRSSVDGRPLLLLVLDPAAQLGVVDLELLVQRRAPALLLVELVEREVIAPLQVDEADQHAAEMRQVCDPRLSARDRGGEGHQAHEQDQVLDLHRYEEVQVDNSVRIEQAIAEKES